MSIKKISVVELVLWVLAFVLILLVASPFALGFKIKNDYASMLVRVSDLVQADIQIASYQRGFFSSDVVLNVSSSNMPFKFQLKEEIIHGPVYLGLLNQGKSPFVAAVISGEMLTPAELAVQINQLFKGSSPLVYQNVIGFSGDVISEGYVPAINSTITTENNSKVNIKSSGVSLVTEFTAQMQKLTGDISLPAFSIGSGLETIEIQGLNLNYAGEMGRNNLLVGDSMLTLKLLDYHSNGEQLSVRLFNVQTMTNEQGKFINSKLQMNAQEILASNVQLGPVAFNMSVNGLDSVKLLEMQNIQKDMEQKLKQGIPDEQVTAMYAGQMLALLPDLLKQSEIKINPLKIDSDIGSLTSGLVFSLEGLDASAPADPLFILNAINLDVSLKIDEDLLRQMIAWQLMSHEQLAAGNEAALKVEKTIPTDQKVTENIQGLLDENWLTMEDRVYESKLSFHQGQMLLNGKPVDPVAYFMSQMAVPAAENTVSP